MIQPYNVVSADILLPFLSHLSATRDAIRLQVNLPQKSIWPFADEAADVVPVAADVVPAVFGDFEAVFSAVKIVGLTANPAGERDGGAIDPAEAAHRVAQAAAPEAMLLGQVVTEDVFVDGVDDEQVPAELLALLVRVAPENAAG